MRLDIPDIFLLLFLGILAVVTPPILSFFYIVFGGIVFTTGGRQ